MPGQTKCWSSIRAKVARVTALDACGRPLAASAPCGFAVTEGFVTISYSPQYDEGEAIRMVNANGDTCVNVPAKQKLTQIDVEIAFCRVDPDLISLITGYETVLDGDGSAVGNRVSEDAGEDVGWALETWSTIPGQACDVGSDQPHGYFLLPWLGPGRIGDFTLENAGATFTYSGSTLAGSGWGVGPWDVTMSGGATPAAGPLLTPIGPTDHLHMAMTTVAPPEATCGCQAMPAAA